MAEGPVQEDREQEERHQQWQEHGQRHRAHPGCRQSALWAPPGDYFLRTKLFLVSIFHSFIKVWQIRHKMITQFVKRANMHKKWKECA